MTSAVAVPVPAPAAAWTGGWKGWATSPSDAGRRLVSLTPTQGTPTAAVDVDPDVPKQIWTGVGASLTDASVELIQQAPRIAPMLFDANDAASAHLNWVRLPLSGTDFSRTPWVWGWDATTASPPAPAIAAAAVVKDLILPLRPDLRVVAVPWTAPASLKVPATERGGDLRSDSASEASYAALLLQQAKWLRDHGVPLEAVALGNEPFHRADYPSMGMSVDQMARLGASLAPQLTALGVGLWAIDHNWEHRSAYDEVLARAPGSFTAAAFHCHGGSPSSMAGVAVPPIVTECTGTNDGWRSTFAWDTTNLVVNAIAAGSTGLMMWNLALDSANGPVDPVSSSACKTCRGLVTVSPAGDIQPGPEFFTLAHVARAADPGSRVLASSPALGIPMAAFANPDGTVGVFGNNETDRSQVVEVRVKGLPTAQFTVAAGELFSLRGPRSQPADVPVTPPSPPSPPPATPVAPPPPTPHVTPAQPTASRPASPPPAGRACAALSVKRIGRGGAILIDAGPDSRWLAYRVSVQRRQRGRLAGLDSAPHRGLA